MTPDRKARPTLYPGGVVVSDAARALSFASDDLRDLIGGWRRTRVGRYAVRYDETWRANHAGSGDAEVLLLGTAMDVDNPRGDQQSVVERLAAALAASDAEFLNRVDALVGAHIIVARRGATHWALSDATAMEALAYDTGGESTLVASYPALVAELRGYEMSDVGKLWSPKDPRPEAKEWRLWAGPWHLPGVSTQYEPVRALTPNTRLDLDARKVERIFPREPIGVLDMDEIVERAAGHLSDTFEWVAREFAGEVSVSVSGGLDSRLGVAASRGVASQLEYFTYYYENHPVHRHDLRAAQTLAERLGLDHRIWPLRLSGMPKGSKEAWERMHQGIHGSGRTEYSHAEHLPPGHLHVRSNVLEVVRGYFLKNPKNREGTFDADRLSRMFRPQTAKVFVPLFEELVAVTEFPLEGRHGLHVTDIYHWEQRLGRWHSEIVRRSKVAHNTFVVWNSRRVLTLMLARPPEDRWKASVVYRLIDRLWPETLETPVFSGKTYVAPPETLPVGAPPFAWERLAPEVRIAFAGALGLEAEDADAAARALAERLPAPTAEAFESQEMVDAALSPWLAGDPSALEQIYMARMAPTRAQRPTAAAARVRRIERRLARPAEEPLRRALAAALRAAGGRLPAIADRVALRPYLLVPTTGLMVNPLEEHEGALLAALRSNGELSTDGVVELAPGGGGRRVLVRRLLDDDVRGGRSVLWVTQLEELLEQTALAFVEATAVLRERSEPLVMRLTGGAYGPRRLAGLAEEGPDVVVATPAALARNAPEVEAFLQRHDTVLVFDGAQTAAATAAGQALQRARELERPVVRLVQAGEAGAQDHVLARQDPAELLAAGALAAARTERVSTELAVDAGLAPKALGPLVAGGIAPQVAVRLAGEGRDARIVETWLAGRSEGRYGPTVVYAIDRRHAEELADRFREAGVATEHITRKRPLRQLWIDRFRRPDFDVLITGSQIAEGLDLPHVDTVLLARPTRSPGLIAEWCTLALRGPAVGGTAEAHLVSFADSWEELTGWVEAGDVFAPTAGAAPDAPPAAVYDFEVETPLADDELERRRHVIEVLEHHLDGYEALHAAAGDDPEVLGLDPFALRERFFGGTAAPVPAAQDLALLAACARRSGKLPPRVAAAGTELTR